MGKTASTIKDKLPEFQKYLLEKNLAPVRNTKIRDRGFFHYAPPSRYRHFTAACSFLTMSVFSQR
jgi:hypothetical protein